jgi:hypothetical protein
MQKPLINAEHPRWKLICKFAGRVSLGKKASGLWQGQEVMALLYVRCSTARHQPTSKPHSMSNEPKTHVISIHIVIVRVVGFIAANESHTWMRKYIDSVHTHTPRLLLYKFNIDWQRRIPARCVGSEKSCLRRAEVMHAKCLRFMNDEQTARLFWSRLHCFPGKRDTPTRHRTRSSLFYALHTDIIIDIPLHLNFLHP